MPGQGQRRRILIIDGDARVRRFVHRALAMEHDVIATAGAAEALTLIASGQRFDLVLCELMMPSISGTEFYRRVGPLAPELIPRTVFLAGVGYSTQAKAFLKRADIRHIDKPLPALEEFRAIVRRYLEGPAGGAQ
jgi:CheY-like chemotaxis protein